MRRRYIDQSIHTLKKLTLFLFLDPINTNKIIPNQHSNETTSNSNDDTPNDDSPEIKIPMTIVYRKKIEIGTPSTTSGNKNAPIEYPFPRPVYMYGYGAYNEPEPDSSFDSAKIPLLDRGFIWVQVELRGGGHLGRQWYEDGKMDKKKNSFYDVIDLCDYLIDDLGYTRKGWITLSGASAGGMLTGAALNMRPDLFANIVATVPFVDVLTVLMDQGLAYTEGEWSEWGNPLMSKKMYEYIKSYAPYENIPTYKNSERSYNSEASTRFPNVFARAGLNDDRVFYWEPAKWVNKLRNYTYKRHAMYAHVHNHFIKTGFPTTIQSPGHIMAESDIEKLALATGFSSDIEKQDHIIVLKTDLVSGHWGKTGTTMEYKTLAEEYAFVIYNTARRIAQDYSSSLENSSLEKSGDIPLNFISSSTFTSPQENHLAKKKKQHKITAKKKISKRRKLGKNSKRKAKSKKSKAKVRKVRRKKKIA